MSKLICAITLTACACLLSACGKSTNAARQIGTPAAVTTTAASTATAAAATTTAAVTTLPAANTQPEEAPEAVTVQLLSSVEVYSQLTVGDIVLDSNAAVTNSSDPLDTGDIGEKKLTLLLDFDGHSYKKELSYTVEDTTPPLVLNSGWNPYAKAGQPFDLDKIVGFADNYDRSPVLTFSGQVDSDTIGCYPITATVTDSSGNSTSWDMDVLVLSEIPAPQDNNSRVDFSDFVGRYERENVRFGIDVSAWQSNVDFQAVKDAGCEFVIMRMGYFYNSYDAPRMDDYYRQNMDGAAAAGLDVGVYIYTDDNTVEGARERARWVCENLDGRTLNFPIAFDWEEWGHFQEYGMNIHDLNAVFEAFCDEVEKFGYSAMLYSSKNFLNSFWQNPNGRMVWLAHFVDETDYTGDFRIWQASAYGRIPGISGDVDMNIEFLQKQ